MIHAIIPLTVYTPAVAGLGLETALPDLGGQTLGWEETGSNGAVYRLPLSPRRLALAKSYFSRPVIRPPEKNEPNRDRTDWKKGEASLERLKGFEEGRLHYQRAMASLGTYLNEVIFKDGRVLQIGSGLGMQRFLGASFRGTWIAADYDPLITKEARTRNPASRFAVSSAYCLPFADNTFDVIYSHAFLDVLADLSSVLAEIVRVLKPGGRLLHLMDCIPNDLVLGWALAQRGFAMKVEGGSLASFFSLDSGLEEVRVFPEPPFHFEGDPLSPEWREAWETYGRQTVLATAKAPVVSYSLLSLAHLLGAMEAVPGFSHLETGALVSMVPTEKQWPAAVSVSNLTRLRRVLIDDAPFWSRETARLDWNLRIRLIFLGWMRLLRRPVPGLEIYLADYILGEKSKQVSVET